MICNTHIVECLRNINVEPEAFSSKDINDEVNASIALIYNTGSCFYSAEEDKPQWWAVDFKRIISISGYSIHSGGSATNNGWIYNWTFSTSIDNKTYKVVHGPAQNLNSEKTYMFSNFVNARYIRIDGNSLWGSDRTTFAFHYVKIFGILKAINMKKYSCKARKYLNIDIIRMILVLCS